jgi:hypothetical protein
VGGLGAADRCGEVTLACLVLSEVLALPVVVPIGYPRHETGFLFYGLNRYAAKPGIALCFADARLSEKGELS